MLYIVDTHSLVWFLEGSVKLGSKAREVLEDDNSRLIIPTIVLVEVKYLAQKGKLLSTFKEIIEAVEGDFRCIVYPLDIQVLEKMPTNLEIHDGIICGTALLYHEMGEKEVGIITRDEKIIKSGLIKTIW